MIQRFQSLFLVGLIILLGISLFTTTWVKKNLQTHESAVLTPFYLTHTRMNGMHVSETTLKPVFYIAGSVIASIGLAFWTIFSFKNRLLQMKICIGNSALLTLILVLNVWGWYQAKALFDPLISGDFAFGFLAPTFALLLNRSAIYFIRRDEKLVRSADRIR